MRGYIFTAVERRMLKTWLSKKEKAKDFSVLKHFILKNTPALAEDYVLLMEVLRSFAR